MLARARLVAVAASLACTGSQADSEPRPSPPPAPAPVALAAGKVTPVTTLFVATDRPPVREVAPPWSLTASDGSGLVLTRVDAKAVVEGPLAFTELHLYFHNPEPRVREGTFSITLPAGAAVSRFAMENSGQFMEAEVVEKQLARRAYEDFLHRRQDPALLEKAEGNQFSARVFPIPARADKHLVISYSHEVTPGQYTLPLRGLAKSERVDVRVQVRGRNGGLAEQAISKRDWTPDRDIVVDGTSVGAASAIVAGELVAARLKVELPSAAAPPASLTILVDTSASRALGFVAQARAVQQLVAELARTYGGALPVQVVAFDQVTAPIYDGRADQLTGLEAKLVERGALGASDLGQALAWLAGHAPKSRVVVVTDAVVTAGAKLDELPALVERLAASGVTRLDVALTGGIRDEQAAASITRARLPQLGAVLDLDRDVAEVARRIGLAVASQLPITVDGARWVFPHAIEAAQAGDEVTVFARRAAQAQQLTVTIAGARTAVSPVSVTPALLGRAFAGAEIAELEAQLAKASSDAASKLRSEIVQRSVAARVVSSQTAMLVLESDADYTRYGIQRSALADILTIGPAGVELSRRAAPAPLQIAEPAPRPETKPLASRPTRGNREMAKQEQLSPLASASSPSADEIPVTADEIRSSVDTASLPQPEPASANAAASGVAQGSAGPAGGNVALDNALSERVEAPRLRRARPDAELREESAAASSRAAVLRDNAARGLPLPPPPPALVPPSPQVSPPARVRAQRRIAEERDGNAGEEDNDDGQAENRRRPALHGPLAEIDRALATGKIDAALARARTWHSQEPGNVLALIGLGNALEASKDVDTAARVYGSIIDLYPARADFRRFAGERLERLSKARALVVDTYRRAVEQRPDHVTGHRLLAYALVRDGQYAAAFAAILAGVDRSYPSGRFAGAERVLAEDVGMIAAAYIAHGGARDEVLGQLATRGIPLATRPSTRFLMYWETDANDVDFHIRDARGGHAWYSSKRLPSGGELYADVTTGYGPECFAIPGTPTAGPYKLSINYYSQGPMGYGMGLLQIQTFDGKGNLRFEDRPYVIMTDQAFVNLGTYR